MNSMLQMTGGFPAAVLAFAVRAFALGLLCAFALRLLRVRNSAFRYAAWQTVLFAMLAMPVASAVMQAISFPRLPAIQLGAPGARQSPAPHRERAQEFPALKAEGLRRSGAPSRSSSSGIQWAVIGLASYFLISMILISRIALGRLLVNRAARRMERLDDPHLLERANLQCKTLGLLNFPEFRAAETIAVPVTFGWRTPVILLPADWHEWTTDKLDLVLAHELSHIQRGDYLIRIVSALNKSLYWFHPLSWWLERRLLELAEHLSDDAALSAVSAPRERYADILGDFAGSPGRASRRFQLGIAMSAPASGSQRIKRILDRQRTLCCKLNLRQNLAVLSVGLLALVVIAGAQTADRPRAQVPGTATQRARRVPAPMFSRAYVDALQGVLELETSDVTSLEHQLEENPRDFAARLKLIAYDMRADRLDLPESRSRRVDLVLWLVEHQPDSEILGSPYGTLSAGDLTPVQLVQARQWWEAVTGPAQDDAGIFWNASNFYQQLDRRLYIVSLERAVALAPENEHYAMPLGLLYAGAILTANPQSMYRDPSGVDSEFAGRARQILDTTGNAYILEPAVRLLKSEYNRSLMMGKENASAGVLAQRYFQRAKMLDPGLDQLWINPQVDPKMIGMFVPGARPPDDGELDWETAAKNIRRLAVDAFPALPPAIREELRNRGCLIPQQTFSDDQAGNQPQNVIEGEFFEKGRASWAVLCSVNESSSILVFRDASDRHPEDLAKSEDKDQLQGAGKGRIAYSRQLAPADRKFIMDHYRAYGGPEPPPIDHQGIDDAFEGKASVTYYWYRGEWKKLTGAD